MKLDLPAKLYSFAQTFAQNGYELYLVGGAVRDKLLERQLKDCDFATNATPQQVQTIFKRTIPTGIKHGTITVLWQDEPYEVTTYRLDGKYTDKRHPDAVVYSQSIQEDLKRRDFTINGLAYSLQQDSLVDLHNGLADLHSGIIRTIGDPSARFAEDALRMLRACRFAAQLNFTIEAQTFTAIQNLAPAIKEIAAERVKEEMDKILITPKPSQGLEYLRQCGLLEHILPELLKGYEVNQNKFHLHDVYYHNVYCCDFVKNTLALRWAALLHDIAKPYCMRSIDSKEDPVFYNHEVIGARIARKILLRLKHSNSLINETTHLIRWHMFHYTDEWTDGAVRRFMRNAGVEKIPQLFALRLADHKSNGLKQGSPKAIYRLQKRVEDIIAAENAISLKDLKINGNDLMQEFSLKPGPVIGQILNYLLEIILDYPEKNQRSILLQEAQAFLEAKKTQAI
jgi:poly(A) polymerase/tRNA nucleotidyltransferase (CCA-adding enzyme)